MWLNIPNIITLSRLGLTPFFAYYFLKENYTASLVIFLVASITDAADGWIARAYGIKTKLGAYLDPLADKVLITTAFILYTNMGLLPAWLLAIILARDTTFLLIILFKSTTDGMIQINPVWSSKVNTTLQIILALIIIIECNFNIDIQSIYFVYGITLTTVISLYQYASIWGKN